MTPLPMMDQRWLAETRKLNRPTPWKGPMGILLPTMLPWEMLPLVAECPQPVTRPIRLANRLHRHPAERIPLEEAIRVQRIRLAPQQLAAERTRLVVIRSETEDRKSLFENG